MTSAPITPPSGHVAREAEREIERDYAALEPEVVRTVRGKLTATGGAVDDQALAASYNQAWHTLYAARIAGREIDNRVGFLVQVTYRRALDERTARRDTTASPVDDEGVDHDLEGQLDDRARVRALMQGMRERLDERELRAATLCYVQGYTRPEAAAALGVRPRRFEKVMDRVSKELSSLVGDLRRGEWCDSRRSLINAYALGVLDSGGERYRLATAHLEDCTACRRRVLCMRGLAGVVPPVPVLAAALPSGGGAGAALTERWSWLARLNGHGAEIAAGGTAVAVATSALMVFGPPGDGGSSEAPPPAVATAPLPAATAAELRASAMRSAAHARADVRRRTAARRSPRGAAPPTATSAGPAAPAAPPAPAPAPEAQPAPAAPAPSPPAATPADDGWEEFELRR